MGAFNVEVILKFLPFSFTQCFILSRELKFRKLMFQCEVVDPVDVQAIATTVTRALGTYGTPALTEIISNCMAQDLSWKVKTSRLAQSIYN